MSGGSIAGMILSLRNNANMLRKRSMFKKESTFLRIKKEYYKASKGKIDLKQLNPIQLRRIRQTIKYNRKESLKHNLIAILFVVPIVLYVGNALLETSSFYPYSTYTNIKGGNSQKKKSEYLFFVTKGDMYIEKEEWHNAIFHYTEALKLFPKEFSANYRLALAYTYSCSHEATNCEAAKYSIDKLFDKFPKNQKVHNLKEILHKL